MRFKDYQEYLDQLEHRIRKLEQDVETLKAGEAAKAPETASDAAKAPETEPEAAAPEAAKTVKASTAKKASTRAKKTNK